MRLYQVTGARTGSESVPAASRMIFAGSRAEASAARMTIVEELSIRKSTIDIQEVDVPTGKVGLLEFLNQLVG